MATFLSPETKSFSPTPTDYKEVARYLGYSKKITPDVLTGGLIEKACEQMLSILKPQAVFEKFDLEIRTAEGKIPELRFADVQLCSVDLERNLNGCNEVYLMAATIGPQVDAMIRKSNSQDPVYAAVLQATGAMYVEKLVDFVNEQIKKEAENDGKKSKPRYSPGFGDVQLEIQRDFFRLLPCTRIGLTLMDTLIMAPEKSVTAFVGTYRL